METEDIPDILFISNYLCISSLFRFNRYEGSLQPVQGIVSVEKARLGTDNSDGASSDGKNTFVPYHIGCESKYSSKSPYGILFVHEKGERTRTYKNVLPKTPDYPLRFAEESFVHVFGSSAPAPPPSKTLGLCLLPPETLEDTTSAMLENVLLHSYFGVKNFVLYDRGLTHKFLDTVSEARQKDDALLSVSLLPWNPPVKLEPEVTEYLVSADCTQRTKAEFQSVAVLKPSQILVPRAARTVGEVLKGQPWAWGPLKVDVLRFCSEFPENPRAAGNEYSINALEQTTFDEEGSEVGGLRLMHRDAANKDRNGPGVVPRDTLAVHDYAPCNKFEFGDTSAKEELHVFNRVSSIQDKIGKYFHHKSV